MTSKSLGGRLLSVCLRLVLIHPLIFIITYTRLDHITLLLTCYSVVDCLRSRLFEHDPVVLPVVPPSAHTAASCRSRSMLRRRTSDVPQWALVSSVTALYQNRGVTEVGGRSIFSNSGQHGCGFRKALTKLVVVYDPPFVGPPFWF